ncbi:hypothetical protein GU926_07095 [Nibribacter ruber]|uniref:DUF2642 domain-containing protein n=1 Tax=Nibribacter ruber TaxID=2698458 RepID=A0A6P1NVX0_9BACT|nr:hypothetical protein [Nibribacter ruber]QHL87210.1 hypothetical protein GU926_07095 [Nibribacter ruber]
MGKRQRRFFQPQIEQEVHQLLGHTIQLVHRQGYMVTGTLQAVQDGVLFVKDGRRHVHPLPLLDVEEIVLDLASDY